MLQSWCFELSPSWERNLSFPLLRPLPRSLWKPEEVLLSIYKHDIFSTTWNLRILPPLTITWRACYPWMPFEEVHIHCSDRDKLRGKLHLLPLMWASPWPCPQVLLHCSAVYDTDGPTRSSHCPVTTQERTGRAFPPSGWLWAAFQELSRLDSIWELLLCLCPGVVVPSLFPAWC